MAKKGRKVGFKLNAEQLLRHRESRKGKHYSVATEFKKGISGNYKDGRCSHPEYYKNYNKVYHQKRKLRPDYKLQKRIWEFSRRVKFKEAGSLTLLDIQKIYDGNLIDNNGILRCVYCNKELTIAQATLDHKYPLSRGGTNERNNLAIACRCCNSSKHDKTAEEYLQWLLGV